MDKELQGPDYAAILADMELKRTALDAAIAALRSAMAAGIFGPVGESFTISPNGAITAIPSPSFADLPRGAFLGKTAPEAIRLYLGTIRRKQTNKEIAQALQDGGLESAGNFDNYVTSALFRLKNDGVVLRFEDGWGLSEWYNEAFRAKIGGQGSKKPAKGSKARRKKAPKKDATSARTRTVPLSASEAKAAAVKGIDDRIVDLLTSNPRNEYGAGEIAPLLEVAVGVVNFSLTRLLKKGRVARSADGQYSAPKEQL
jgi:hypothetical protein